MQPTKKMKKHAISTITSIKKGEKNFLERKMAGYLKCWRDYLIWGSGCLVLPGPSGDRKGLAEPTLV